MKPNTSPDWPALRALFPALKECAYFGWAATAPLSVRAADAMARHIAQVRDHGGLPWREWYQTYDAVRAETAKLIDELSPAQMLRIAQGNMLVCRFRFDDAMLWSLLADREGEGRPVEERSASRLHASILMSGNFEETLNERS